MKINEAFDWFVNKCINEDCGAELWDLPDFFENEKEDLIFDYTCKQCGSQYKCFFDSESYWTFNIHQWSKEWGEHRPFFRLTPLTPIKLSKSQYVNPKLRFEILKRDNYRCQICGATAKYRARLEIDHKIPRSRGGTDDPSNLWTFYFTCNRGKGNSLV
jgi:5-methylcytosine-specific restriction endonuclease McrA